MSHNEPIDTGYFNEPVYVQNNVENCANTEPTNNNTCFEKLKMIHSDETEEKENEMMPSDEAEEKENEITEIECMRQILKHLCKDQRWLDISVLFLFGRVHMSSVNCDDSDLYLDQDDYRDKGRIPKEVQYVADLFLDAVGGGAIVELVLAMFELKLTPGASGDCNAAKKLRNLCEIATSSGAPATSKLAMGRLMFIGMVYPIATSGVTDDREKLAYLVGLLDSISDDSLITALELQANEKQQDDIPSIKETSLTSFWEEEYEDNCIDKLKRDDSIRQVDSKDTVEFVREQVEMPEDTEASTWIKCGEATANFIVTTARIFQTILTSSTYLCHTCFRECGQCAKENIVLNEELSDNSTGDETTDESVAQPSLPTKRVSSALKYAGTAKRATTEFMEVSKFVTIGVREAAARAVYDVGDILEEEQVGRKIVPHQAGRDMCAAVGKVTLATLGAAFIVTDSIFETTMTVGQNGAAVAADVVRHAYGDDAGMVISETSESVYNSVRGIRFITMLEPVTLTKVIAKEVGRISVPGETSKSEDLKVPTSLTIPLSLMEQALIEIKITEGFKFT